MMIYKTKKEQKAIGKLLKKLSAKDLNVVAQFHRIILNYLKMKKLLN